MCLNKEKNPYGVIHLLSSSQGKLLDVISTETPHTKEKIAELLDLGAIYLNHKRILVNCDLKINDYLRIHTTPRRFSLNMKEIKSRIVCESKDFIVCDKPHGLPSIPTVDNLRENFLSAMSLSLNQTLHVTSRLDIATSGLIVYAKNKEFQKFFNYQMSNGHIEKRYLAIVTGEYQGPNYLVHHMLPSIKAPKQVVNFQSEGSQICELKILKQNFNQANNTTDLYIELITGRTHQIRSQLSFVGYPIIGDKMYGSTITLNQEFEKINLKCITLSFENLFSERQTYELENM